MKLVSFYQMDELWKWEQETDFSSVKLFNLDVCSNLSVGLTKDDSGSQPIGLFFTVWF